MGLKGVQCWPVLQFMGHMVRCVLWYLMRMLEVASVCGEPMGVKLFAIFVRDVCLK